MKQFSTRICLFALVLIAINFATNVNAECSGYYWLEEECNYLCDLDEPLNWDKSKSAPPSPKNEILASLDLPYNVTASTTSNYDIWLLQAPICPGKRAIEETLGGSNLIDVKFSDNTILLRQLCAGGIKTTLTWTNSTLKSKGDHVWYFNPGGVTFRWIDSIATLNHTGIRSVVSTKYELTNSKLHKRNAYLEYGKISESGFYITSGDLISLHSSEFITPCPLWMHPKSNIIVSGASKIGIFGNESCSLTGLGVAGNLTVKAGASVNITTPIFASTQLSEEEYPTRSTIHFGQESTVRAVSLISETVANITVDFYGSLYVEEIFSNNTQLINDGSSILNEYIMHTGSTVDIKNSLNLDGGSAPHIFTFLNNGGQLFVNAESSEYVIYINKFVFTTQAGLSHFKGNVQVTEGSEFNFNGGNIVFDKNYTSPYPVNIEGSIVTLKGHIVVKPGVTDVHNINAGGLILVNGNTADNVVVKPNAYLSGYGKITGDLTVNPDGEVRLTHIEQILTVTGTAEIESDAVIVFHANNELAARAVVGTLNLSTNTTFKMVYEGQTAPPNGAVYTLLKYTTFNGVLPNKVIEDTFGLTLSVIHDIASKEIRVRVQGLLPPSVETPPSSAPTISIVNVFVMFAILICYLF